MWILANFTRNGVPALGLLPLVYIRDIETGILIISGSEMVEKGDGFYGYDFSSYIPSRNYSIMCDSITLSGTERYTYSSSGEYTEVLDSIESATGLIDVRTDLIRKIWTNKLELFDGNTNNWILYDDDGSTPLLTFDVTDKNGGEIIQQVQSPSKRSTASGTISGSLTPDIYMRKSIYDQDDNAIVDSAENINDGVYISTASEVYQSVINTHSSYKLGSKFITESGIANDKFVQYDLSSDTLVYTDISGTLDHAILINRDASEQHPATAINTDVSTFSGVLSALDYSVQYAFNTLDQNVYTKSEIDALIGNNKSGISTLNLGDIEATVVFSSQFDDANYKLFYSLKNDLDSPSSEYAITTINTTSSGFTVHFSGEIDSNNYKLHWLATSSGISSYSGTTEVHDDTSPALGGDLYINSYGLEMDVTPSGDVLHGYIVGYSGEISKMYVDWNDTGVGCPLHMKSNGHWEQCTATSGTTRMPCGSLALEEGVGLKKILWKGIIRKGSWTWTPGDLIYVSTVEGALANVCPIISGSWSQPVGFAIASDTIRFDLGFYSGIIV